MKAFVTGGAGFIGSNLADRLRTAGHEVVIYDNLSTGQRSWVARDARLIVGDTLDRDALTNAMRGCDMVFHIAANADVRFGLQHPFRDLEQNTIATFNVLEAVRANGIGRLAFSSTGSIYGEADVFPTPENAPFPIQTSIYGASKLGAEGFIQAYSEGFEIQVFIFRFVSILGERYTHGHVFDFVKSLRNDPTHLRVLGDGKQRKSYLYVQDCVDAILRAVERSTDRVNILNVGSDEYCEVTESIRWITERMAVSPHLEFSGGRRGWVGDSPFIFLDCSRIRALGWKPSLTIEQAVIRTVDYLQSNPWLLESRA